VSLVRAAAVAWTIAVIAAAYWGGGVGVIVVVTVAIPLMIALTRTHR
jgi:hypothetical protein